MHRGQQIYETAGKDQQVYVCGWYQDICQKKKKNWWSWICSQDKEMEVNTEKYIMLIMNKVKGESTEGIEQRNQKKH